MYPVVILFWVSIGLAALSFGFFAAVTIQRINLIRRIAKPIPGGAGQVDRTGRQTMDAELHSLSDAPEKFIEALAKLTESLSKAPLLVTTLIAAIFFTTVALAAATLDAGHRAIPADTLALSTPIEHCTVGYFSDADHRLPTNIRDSPAGCLGTIGARLRKESPSLLLFIGRSDARELNRESRRKYSSNLTLAYQRALSVSKYLLETQPGKWPASEELASRSILLAAGSSSVGAGLTPALLEEDRIVEIIPFWIHLGKVQR